MPRNTTYYTGGAGGKLVRLKTAIITPEELFAECQPVAPPIGIEQALVSAAITLREDLRLDLENFPYREQLTHPRAISARIHAITLAQVLAALHDRKRDYERVAPLIDETLEGEKSC